MTELRHLRCDRCDVDVIADDRMQEREWARCMIGLEKIDFCPACWRTILEFARGSRAATP